MDCVTAKLISRLGRNISSIENDFNLAIGDTWSAIDKKNDDVEI